MYGLEQAFGLMYPRSLNVPFPLHISGVKGFFGNNTFHMLHVARYVNELPQCPYRVS